MKKGLLNVLLISLTIYIFLGDVRYFLNSNNKSQALSDIFSLDNLRVSLTFVIAFIGFGLWVYYIFTKFYTAKKTKKIITFLVGGVLISIAFRYIADEIIGVHYFGRGNYNQGTKVIYYFIDNCYYSILYGSIAMVYFFIQHSFKTEKEKLLLAAENKATQLKFLKSQINPHFLFNSLNNIYSLVYQKSDNALPAVDKLSKLLRYSLYEADHKVSIKKEFDQIQHFIDLQSLRREKPIHYKIETTLRDSMIQIPPLLLIPFVENAFKHGDLHNSEDPISINLFTAENQLIYNVSNVVKIQQKDNVGGIGLKNIQKRLELLYGPKRHFNVEEKNNRFTATLKIPVEL